MIFPIVMLILALVGGGAYLFITKINKKKKVEEIDKDLVTAQDFVNVLDIKGNFLYSKDKYVFVYMRINPISIELLSNREKRNLAKELTAELSSVFLSIRNKFRFLAVSRPMDIAPLINDYSIIMANSDNQKQKELLRHEMKSISTYATSGENVERQFYIRLYDKYEDNIEKDLIRKITDLKDGFENNNITCDILKEQEIVRLCNLINNPAYSHIEDGDFEAAIPIIIN